MNDKQLARAKEKVLESLKWAEKQKKNPTTTIGNIGFEDAKGGPSNVQHLKYGLTLKKLKDYANGEQFGAGDYWKGRVPGCDEDERIPDWNKILRVLVIDDFIGYAIKKIRSAIMGTAPRWKAEQQGSSVSTALLEKDKGSEEKDLDPEEKAIAEALKAIEDPLKVWSKDAKVFDKLKDFHDIQAWAESACLRIYIPEEYEDEPEFSKDGIISGCCTDSGEAYELLEIEALDPTQAGAIRNSHGNIQGYWFGYTEEPEPNAKDKHVKQCVEISLKDKIYHFYHEGGELKPIKDSDGEDKVFDNPLFDEKAKRRPKFLMLELSRNGGALINESVITLQDRINVDNTNMAINSNYAGFRAWVLKNVDNKVPILDTDGSHKKDEEGDKLYKIAEVAISATGITNLIGAEKFDAQGNHIGYEMPDAKVVDPVDPTKNLIPTINHWVEQLLSKFDLLWTRRQAGVQSGLSRQELRVSFEKEILLQAPVYEEALEWILKTTYLYACHLTIGSDLEAAKQINFRSEFQLDIERISIDKYESLLKGYEAGTVSLETLVSNIPVSGINVDTELRRIRKVLEQKKLDDEEHNTALKLLASVKGDDSGPAQPVQQAT